MHIFVLRIESRTDVFVNILLVILYARQNC